MTTFTKLDDESLKKEPEEVFDLLDKLGEGSYGAVYKARHKATSDNLAVKIVPVDSDLQEIIKEISMMQQCDSDHIVKYYGSYFKTSDLWIVMEYCGGGSVADIMRLRKKPMKEIHIQLIIRDALNGLAYLHNLRKIHRDIKAGNILLADNGVAKLADFGVAGQLSDSMSRRNTVIGTPYWMAPEVIQEVGYNETADIWSMGITCIELAEGRPPHSHIHPMRAIFLIPTSPAPSLRHPRDWSPSFVRFLKLCLEKDPANRKTAHDLQQADFIVTAPKSRGSLVVVIDETKEIIEAKGRYPQENGGSEDSETQEEEEEEDEDGGDSDFGADVGTIVRGGVSSSLSSTMVIKEDTASDTMLTNGTSAAIDTMHQSHSNQASYKPAFLAHFEHKGNDDGDAPANAPAQTAPLTAAKRHEPKQLTEEEILAKLASLESEKQRELKELHELYQAKRNPILKAIETKKSKAISS